VTVPRPKAGPAKRVSDLVRELIPSFRKTQSREFGQIAVHLRGNEDLYEGLKSMISSRIEGRANLPVPSDPLECMRRLAMDKEASIVLAQLESIYTSPVLEPAKDSEQPA
jgi:hypothetical protein